MIFGRKSIEMPTADTALPGRDVAVVVPDRHHVNGHPLVAPDGGWPDHLDTAVFGMGCFWGAERIFWQAPGVYSTAVGYAGGFTPNPTYEETCSGLTGHTEVVLVVFDTNETSYEAMLKIFWENHDPTQGMRQGNDMGSQYRSAIFTYGPEQAAAAETSARGFEPTLAASGYGPITSEIAAAADFFYAEDYHQQYLSKVPNGYCGMGGTGLTCPIGVATTS